MKKLVLLLLLNFCFSCKKEFNGIVPNTNWGADHASLITNPEEWYIELDCAHVIISNPEFDKNGNFNLPGEYFQEFGIVIEDPDFEGNKPQPALVNGKIYKDKIELTLKLSKDNLPIGTYTFQINKDAILFKCA